jgi:hypothetical protein
VPDVDRGFGPDEADELLDFKNFRVETAGNIGNGPFS